MWKTFQRRKKWRNGRRRRPSRSAAWLLNFSRFQKQTKKKDKRKIRKKFFFLEGNGLGEKRSPVSLRPQDFYYYLNSCCKSFFSFPWRCFHFHTHTQVHADTTLTFDIFSIFQMFNCCQFSETICAYCDFYFIDPFRQYSLISFPHAAATLVSSDLISSLYYYYYYDDDYY